VDFSEIRRVAITAFFSDDELLERLVLKGGNALDLIYGLTSRTSLDLDFSMADDFEDLDDARRRIFRALRDRFDARGYVVFDERLDPKPRIEGEDTKPWWGGYELRFKLMEHARYEMLKRRPEALSRNALVTGTGQRRNFTVDLSKCEYVSGKAEREFDDYLIYVYTPEMIVIEKLRAICQQMPEYEHRGRPTPRARDFYDIQRVVATVNVHLADIQNLELVRHIFAAKRVPVELLARIKDTREFHRVDWPAVVESTAGALEEFDYYFESVISEVERLESLWMEEPPL
jgi:hypothetical protein